MRILSQTFSDPGGRTPNEDAAGFYSNGDFRAWIAADGLGGHADGEAASACAAETLEEIMSGCTAVNEEFVRDSMRELNAAVSRLNGPLTTAVCAFTDGKTLWYANNGDSRLYFLRKNKITHRTNDHSLAYLAYRKDVITYEDIPTHPGQSRLLHSLGSDFEFAGEFYDPIPLEPGDAFLLCTDGFWELIKDAEIERSLRISDEPEAWLDLMLSFVRQRLKDRSDNYTAAIGMVVH